MRRYEHTGGDPLFIIMSLIYVGVLLLFASQTWFFVSWLFPDSQILMKILTVLCFDVMSLLWALLDLQYKFASRGARTVVRFGWAISFLLSLLASVFYLVLESMLRFDILITGEMVNTGYGVTISAVTLTVIFLTWFLYLEWSVRHPIEIEAEAEAEAIYPVSIQEIETIPQPQTNTRPMIALPSLPKFWKRDPAPTITQPTAITEDLIQQLRELIREEVTTSQKKNETIPLPVAAPAATTGAPGRLSRQREYAKKWAKWEATGFDLAQCPWKNPYAFKSRKPAEELLIEARKALSLSEA